MKMTFFEPNECPTCLRDRPQGTAACRNRNCKKFAGQKKSPAFFNSLVRGQRRKAQIKKTTIERPARNCKRNVFTTRQTRAARRAKGWL